MKIEAVHHAGIQSPTTQGRFTLQLYIVPSGDGCLQTCRSTQAFPRHGGMRCALFILLSCAPSLSLDLRNFFWPLDLDVVSRDRAIELDPSNHVFYSNRR